MKKLLFLTAMFIAGLFNASAQSTPSFGLYQTCQLQSAMGQAISGADVYFLSQPANTTTLTPQAQVYSSPTSGTVSQPIVTDGFGQCSAYLTPGLYTVCYVSPFIGQRCFTDQYVGLPPDLAAYLLLTGGTLTGPLTINDAATGAGGITSFSINQVGYEGNSAEPVTLYSPNLTAGGTSTLLWGQGTTAYQQAALTFNYAGANSSNNSVGLGLEGFPQLTINGNGMVSVPDGLESSSGGSTSICWNTAGSSTNCSSSMVYPPSGVPTSTASAWGSSYQVGTAANDLVQLTSGGALPSVSGANLTGTASALSIGGNAATATNSTYAANIVTTLNTSGGSDELVFMTTPPGSYGTPWANSSLTFNPSSGNLASPVFTASSEFSGPGTGLTGTASSLTAGNASELLGSTWASPASLGSTTPAAVKGTTVTATSSFSGPGTSLTGTASSLSIGGNAATATQFASTPSQCGSATWATGITANGTPNCSTPTFTPGDSSISTPSIAGTGTATFTAGSAMGTGYTGPSCLTVCDSVSGTITLTTGSSASTGPILEATLPYTRTNDINCVVNAYQSVFEETPTVLAVSAGTTANTLSVYTNNGASLSSSATYHIVYWCGGN